MGYHRWHGVTCARGMAAVPWDVAHTCAQPQTHALLAPTCPGGAPGRLAEINFNASSQRYEVVAEWHGGVGGARDGGFVPHGFDRNGPNGSTLVSVDYLDMVSAFQPSKKLK
jgi:hypothetical protein